MSREVPFSAGLSEFKNEGLLIFDKVCVVSRDDLVNVGSEDFVFSCLNDKE